MCRIVLLRPWIIAWHDGETTRVSLVMYVECGTITGVLSYPAVSVDVCYEGMPGTWMRRARFERYLIACMNASQLVYLFYWNNCESFAAAEVLYLLSGCSEGTTVSIEFCFDSISPR
jgi:hypothetical protein